MSNEPQVICQIKKKCQNETFDLDFKPEEPYLTLMWEILNYVLENSKCYQYDPVI